MQTVSKDLFKKGGRRKSDVTQLTDSRILISLEHNERMEKNNNCYAKIEKADGVGDGVGLSVGVSDNGKGMSVGMNINDNIARGTHSADDIREDSMKEIASVRERIPRTHSLQEIVKKHMIRIPRPPSMESVKVIRNHAPTIPNTSIPSSSSSFSSSRQRGQTANRTERRWAGLTMTEFSGGGSDVRAQDGQTYLRMRGPPSCFPVWFVGKSYGYIDRLTGRVTDRPTDRQTEDLIQYNSATHVCTCSHGSNFRTFHSIYFRNTEYTISSVYSFIRHG